MILEIEDLPLHLVSASVAGAALKILQAGGSELDESKMRRAVGSPYLFKQHRGEILDLVQDMEAKAKP